MQRATPHIFFRLALAVVVLAGAISTDAAADLNAEVERKERALARVSERSGLLTTEIQDYSRDIDRLTVQVADLRNREAEVAEALGAAEARLQTEEQDLKLVRDRLVHSRRALARRLVDIYKEGSPSVVSILLETNGFDELMQQSEYLSYFQEQDASIVGEVRELTVKARETVERVESARDEIEARKAELTATREQLEGREAELAEAREVNRLALADLQDRRTRLEGQVADLEQKIQQRLAAAQAAAQPSSVPTAGPVPAGGGAMIWPIDGTVTSPFGQRWGRLHAGLDIAAPGGTPIRAAASGTIAFAQTEAESGGYGNYTCIDHGGGLSSCYAHQSAFEVTSGPVEQGDVIGYVGNTGNSFGDHLHFEVRSNTVPTDPMGYL